MAYCTRYELGSPSANCGLGNLPTEFSSNPNNRSEIQKNGTQIANPAAMLATKLISSGRRPNNVNILILNRNNVPIVSPSPMTSVVINRKNSGSTFEPSSIITNIVPNNTKKYSHNAIRRDGSFNRGIGSGAGLLVRGVSFVFGALVDFFTLSGITRVCPCHVQ